MPYPACHFFRMACPPSKRILLYTFWGQCQGGVCGGRKNLCLLRRRNSFILCLQIHNSCIGWNERFLPFFLLDRHSVFLAMVPDFPYMDLVARGNHSGPTCHLHGRMFHPPGSVIKSLSKEGRNSRKTAYEANLWDVKPHSHSIVPGGLLVISYTTRFIPRTSLTMRLEHRSSTS